VIAIAAGAQERERRREGDARTPSSYFLMTLLIRSMVSRAAA
jgi:hypothetical protein